MRNQPFGGNKKIEDLLVLLTMTKASVHKAMKFTEIEREVISLWISIGALDSMINHIILGLVGSGNPKEIHFKTEVHQQLFNILLLDFLENVDKTLTGVAGSCVELLEEVCRLASFNISGSVNELGKPLQKLETWLETEITVETYFPSISRTIPLEIKRKDSLYICGNISKHNVSRLTGAGKKLGQILQHHNVIVDSKKVLYLLGDFYKRFHEDILEYQATVITELLNNVRWGIHNYLFPEYLQARTQDTPDSIQHSFRFPQDVTDDFVKTCYWELMNSVRRKPNMEPFIADSLLKRSY